MKHEAGLAVIGPFKKDMFTTEKIKQNCIGEVIEKDHSHFLGISQFSDPDNHKNLYDAGVLNGTWYDKKEMNFYKGQLIEIKADMTWTVNGDEY